MVAVITNYDLDVLSVTLDNASVNDAAMRDFAGRLDDQNIFHLIAGCCLEIVKVFLGDIRSSNS